MTGADLGTKKVFWLAPDELVLNIVFAWEGAVAHTGKGESGKIGSHRFVTLQHNPEEADLGYLALCLQSEAGIELLRAASPGSAGRNRTLSAPTLLAESIPLPCLEEQRRTARRLERQGGLVDALRSKSLEQRDRSTELLESLLTRAADSVAVGDAAVRVSRPVAVDPEERYDLLGVRWYGEGAFLRESLIGRDIGAKKLNRVCAGDFIYNRLIGWKGSFALSAVDGYVSNEFPLYVGRDGVCSTEYLAAVCRLPNFAEQAERLSRGATTASRKRLREDAFERLCIPLLGLEGQKQFCEATRLVDALASADRRKTQLLKSLLPASLNAAFGTVA